jgi:hypothetical protein
MERNAVGVASHFDNRIPLFQLLKLLVLMSKHLLIVYRRIAAASG